jgi:hypothetical protein
VIEPLKCSTQWVVVTAGRGGQPRERIVPKEDGNEASDQLENGGGSQHLTALATVSPTFCALKQGEAAIGQACGLQNTASERSGFGSTRTASTTCWRFALTFVS